MAISKTSLGLSLPDKKEHYSVELFNENFSLLDEQCDKIISKIGIKDYDSSKTYKIGSVCSNDGDLYECIFDISTPEEWTAAHWKSTSLYELLGSLDDKADEIEAKIRNDLPEFVYDENGKITGYKTSIGGADTVFPFSSEDKIGSDLIVDSVYVSGSSNQYIIPSERFYLQIVGYRNMYSASTKIQKYTITGATVEQEISRTFKCICSSGSACISGNLGVLKLICTGKVGDTITPVVYFKESSGATGDKARMVNWIVTMIPLSD